PSTAIAKPPAPASRV
ncbi:unnamed protein product, partial [Rotaria sp. Silwood1]